jgi:DNA-binding CsgD family transcriptional regulator
MSATGTAARSRVPAGCPLTNTQYEMISLIARGKSIKQVAQIRGCTDRNVAALLGQASRRLGVSGSQAAVVKMMSSGWLEASARSPEDGVVPPVALTYSCCFVRLCRERSSRAAAILTLAYGLLSAMHDLPRRRREPPDIDEWLLWLARCVVRPIPD